MKIDNFSGLKNLIMVSPFSGNENWYLSNNQHFELSASGKRLYIIDDLRDMIIKTFNIKSCVAFGYKEEKCK